MKSNIHPLFFPAVTLVLAVVSLVVFFYSCRSVMDDRRRIADGQRSLNEMAQFESSVQRGEAALQQYGQLPNGRLIDIRKMTASLFPDVDVQLNTMASETLANNWTLRRIEVTIPRAELSTLGRLISMMEMQRPPWSVVRMDINGLAEKATASVSLIAEGLEKSGP